MLALEPHQAEVDRNLALRLQLPLGLGTAGVLGQEHAHHADVAREPDRVDQSVEREAGVLVSLGVVCLVADALTAVVGAQTEGGFLDDLCRLLLGGVDRDGPDLLRLAQPVGLVVGHPDAAGDP